MKQEKEFQIKTYRDELETRYYQKVWVEIKRNKIRFLSKDIAGTKTKWFLLEKTWETPRYKGYTTQLKTMSVFFSIPKLTNWDLSRDIERIEGFNLPITVSRAYDSNLDYPYAIDIEDTSYWYLDKRDRDHNFEVLKNLFPKFKFI